jgi:hypothetical protein
MLAGVLALAILAPSGRGQDTGAGLAQVPADAPLVVAVRGFERTKERLVKLVSNAAPDHAAMIQAKLDEALKEGLDGRQLKGLAKDGPLFVVFTELPKPGEAEPAVAVIAAVTDFKAFRDGILTDEERKGLKETDGYESASVRGHDVFFIDRKGFAVVTGQKETAAKLAKKGAGLDGKLKADAKTLLESDVALYVDMVAVNKEFGDQIKSVRPLIEFGLQQAGGQMDKASQEMAKTFFNAVFQFIEDSRNVLLGLDFRPEGLVLRGDARVAAESKINLYLKDAKRAPLGELGTLPTGYMTYTAAYLGPELNKAFEAFLRGVYAGEDTNQGKKVKEAFEQLNAAGPGVLRTASGVPATGISVMDYKDPAKAEDAQFKLFQVLQSGETFGNVPLKEKPVVQRDAQTHRGFKLHMVSLKWDFEKMAERTPQLGKEMAEAMKTMMGEGMNIWFGTDGKTTLSVTAKDWPAAQKALDRYLDGKETVGKQAPFQEARKQLPAEASLTTLVDAPQYTQVMAEFVGPLLKAQGLPITIPPLKAPVGKSYFSMAVVLRPETAGFEFWLPVTAVAEIRKMIEPIIHGSGIQ